MLRAAFIILVLYVILSASDPTRLFPYCHRERQRGDPRE